MLFGCSKATWWRRVADGTLPQPIRIGGMSRWKLSDVLILIEALSAAAASGKAPFGETSPRATRAGASASSGKC